MIVSLCKCASEIDIFLLFMTLISQQLSTLEAEVLFNFAVLFLLHAARLLLSGRLFELLGACLLRGRFRFFLRATLIIILSL